MKASKILKNVEFSVGDYNNIISKVKKGDLFI
jgi:site-specific DNA-adenine methylase